jgi:hypothetical protein
VGNCLASAVVARWEGDLGPVGAPAPAAAGPTIARGATEPAHRTGT